MAKDDGLFYVLDEASRQLKDNSHVFDRISYRRIGANQQQHIKVQGNNEFSVAHYTGTLLYDATEITEKNRDFVPPEMIETMRQSEHATVREFFSNKLTKGGALTIHIPEAADKEKEKPKKTTARSKWGAALLQAEQTNLRVN